MADELNELKDEGLPLGGGAETSVSESGSSAVEGDLLGLHRFEVMSSRFNGPFDVLFQMIRDKQIPIEEMALADLTSQFLSYVSANVSDAPGAQWVDTSSEFLVIAAYLVELKSKALLPVVEMIQEDEEVQESLLDHLVSYSSFKEAARQLFERKQLFDKIFVRTPRKEDIASLPPPEVHLKGVSTGALLQAFSKVWQEALRRDQGREIIDEPITVEQRIEEILERLAQTPHQIKFEDLFVQASRFHVVVTFLAMLELIRLRTVQVVQEQIFGQIVIVPRREEEKSDGS